MRQIKITYLLIFLISSLLSLHQVEVKASTDADLAEQIQKAINLHYEGKHDESLQILDLIPTRSSDELPIFAVEITEIIRSMNYIATKGCLNTEIIV